MSGLGKGNVILLGIWLAGCGGDGGTSDSGPEGREVWLGEVGTDLRETFGEDALDVAPGDIPEATPEDVPEEIAGDLVEVPPEDIPREEGDDGPGEDRDSGREPGMEVGPEIPEELPADPGRDPGPVCSAVWTDPETGLQWENCPALARGTWNTAMARCETLVHAGFDDWRLPTLSELRGLIRGCPDTVTGGACRASDTCLGETPADSCLNRACTVPACDLAAGPSGGCYRPAEVAGECDYEWTASVSATYDDSAWIVDFLGAILTPTFKASEEVYHRCVRGP